MATKPVKHILSTMAGAPVLSGTQGSLIAVLDTLVNGYNLMTLDSLVVAGNVLTGSKAGHGFVVNQVIATSANEAALIGEWTVTSVTSGTFTADATGVANTTGTGTLSAKGAGAGWLKVFAGTNKAVYKSSDPTSTGCCLRVDDTGTTSARVVGYESMTDIDTGVGPFPNGSQQPGGFYWDKSSTASATARDWLLVADSSMFYIIKQHNGVAAVSTNNFGDYPSERPGDTYNCCLSGTITSAYLSSVNQWALGVTSAAVNASVAYSPRGYTQIGSPVVVSSLSTSLGTVGGSGGAAAFVYPSQANNGLVLSKPILREISGPIRSLNIPGLFHTPQTLPLNHLDIVENVSGLPGRKVIAAFIQPNSSDGRVFFDITGPWR